jgi:hypothetical protein
MRFRDIVKIALAVAAVWGVAQPATAGIPITTPTTVPTAAAVDNSMTIVVSNTDLGRFSVVGKPLDTATASFTPGGSPSGDPGMGINSPQPASFVWDLAHPPQTPTVALSAGFHNAPIFITYSSVVDLSCPGGTIRITHITDDLATPTIWDKPPGGPITSSAGQDLLDGTGAKTFHIGMTFMTTNSTYSSGACTGSFDFTVEY